MNDKKQGHKSTVFTGENFCETAENKDTTLHRRVEHYRFPVSSDKVPFPACTGRHGTAFRYWRSAPNFQAKPNGGYTVVTLSVNGKKFVGVAECSPKDHFDYKKGRTLATERAISQVIQSYVPEVVSLLLRQLLINP